MHTVAREIEQNRGFNEKIAHYCDKIPRPFSARPELTSESRDKVASASNVSGVFPAVRTISKEIDNSRSSAEKMGKAWKQFAAGLNSYSFGLIGHPIKV